MPQHHLRLLYFVLFIFATGMTLSLLQASIIDSKDYSDRITYLQFEGSPEKAVELARKYVTEETQKYGPDHKKTYQAMLILGQALFMDAKYEEASKVLTSSLAGYEKLVGVESKDLKPYLDSLSTLFFTMSRYPEAYKLAHRANSLIE